MANKLTPPDYECCQAEKPGNGPFTVGGSIGNPKNGYRVRCESKPRVIVTEREPAEDGSRGSMSLCEDCLTVFYKQQGREFADVEEILQPREPA